MNETAKVKDYVNARIVNRDKGNPNKPTDNKKEDEIKNETENSNE